MTTQAPVRTQNPGPYEDPRPRTMLKGPRLKETMRTQVPIEGRGHRTQDPMKAQDPNERTKNSRISEDPGHRTL